MKIGDIVRSINSQICGQIVGTYNGQTTKEYFKCSNDMSHENLGIIIKGLSLPQHAVTHCTTKHPTIKGLYLLGSYIAKKAANPKLDEIFKFIKWQKEIES